MKTVLNFGLVALLFFFTSLNFSCKKAEEMPCVKKTWYQDADGDGKGNKAMILEACEKPAGYVSNSDDDDDNPIKNTIPTRGYITPTFYANMKLAWADEFNEISLDEKYWNYEIGNGSNGWGNN